MDLTEQLNKQQEKAVLTTQGSVLVLAGAGSGKTRALTFRTAHLLSKGISSDRILTLTFTNKAAEDMKRKMKELLEDKKMVDKLWMGTFHGICLKILSRHLGQIGYKNNYVIMDTAETKSLINEIINDIGLDSNVYKTNIVMNIIDEAKRKLMTPEKLKSRDNKGEDFFTKIAKVYREYEKRLKSLNAFDFNDLIKKTIELFREYPDVLKRYQNQFEYIQIDEYQDTNKSQYIIATMLAKPQDNIFVVGDDYQSIYKFRGAEVSNILNFDKNYTDTTVIKLERNYRSCNNIIEASNAVIEKNSNQAEKNSWTDKTNVAPIVICEAEDNEAEAVFVAKTIHTLVRNKQYDYKDFAILYRSNAQSRELESAFINKGIPHKIVGGLGFFDRKEIRDIMAMLTIMVNPNNIMAIARVMGIESNGIGVGAISKIYQYASEKGLEFIDILPDPKSVSGIGKIKAERIRSFDRKWIDGALKIKDSDLSLPEKIKTLIKEVGYFEILKEDMKSFENRKDNVNEFLNLSANYYKKNTERTIDTFIRDIKLMSDQDDIDDKNTTKLMTVHASKGLEFPVIFLVGLEENLFPHARSIEEGEEGIEEERRLCYVGMTRGEQRLLVSHCQERSTYYGSQDCEPSRFLDEIPSILKKEIKVQNTNKKNHRYSSGF